MSPAPIRLLIIDGDRRGREELRIMAESRGYIARAAATGMEALGLAMRWSLDAFLVAERIDDISQTSLIARLLGTCPQAAAFQVVALETKHPFADERVKALPNGLSRSELLYAIDRHFDRDVTPLLPELAAGTALRVLVLEDDPSHAELFSTFLTAGDSPLRVTSESRLERALSHIHRSPFDVIVADLNLPDSRGPATVVSLQQAAPTSAIVVLTAIDDEDLAIQAIRQGAQDYLVKMRVNRSTLRRAVTFAFERKRSEERLAYLAYHDSLTGLDNRVSFATKLQQALLRSRRGAGHLLLYVDLDGFKQINDQYGHLIGDAVLEKIAARIRSTLRQDDVAARLGGDEFGIIATSNSERGRMDEEIPQRLLRALVRPLEINGREIPIRVSIGAAKLPTREIGVRTVLSRVDEAMYRSKREGPNLVTSVDLEPKLL